MKLSGIIKTGTIIMAAVIAAFVLTACSGKGKAPEETQPETEPALTVTEYQEQIRGIVDKINSTLNGIDTENAESVVSVIPELKTLYSEVAGLSAPEQLKEPAGQIQEICGETIEILDLTEKVLTIDEANVTADDMKNVSALQSKTTSLEDLQTRLENALTLVFYTTSDGEIIAETVNETE